MFGGNYTFLFIFEFYEYFDSKCVHTTRRNRHVQLICQQKYLKERNLLSHV